MAIHQRSPVRGVAPAVWPLLGLFLSSGAAVLAQTQPPGPTPARPVGSAPMWSRQASPDLLYTAARPPELTYTNSTYGISFRFPSNFYFDKLSRIGPAAQRNVKRHGDPEEILLASVVIPLGFGAGTNASGADLLVGVNPGLSRESCAALTATDKQTMGRARNLSAGGLELSGRSTIEENVPPGPMDTYRREYTGYANGVCYEFEVGFALINPARLRSPWPVAPADVGRLYAELEAMILTAQFTKPIPAAKPAQTMTEHVTYPWETSLPFPSLPKGTFRTGGYGRLENRVPDASSPANSSVDSRADSSGDSRAENLRSSGGGRVHVDHIQRRPGSRTGGWGGRGCGRQIEQQRAPVDSGEGLEAGFCRRRFARRSSPLLREGLRLHRDDRVFRKMYRALGLRREGRSDALRVRSYRFADTGTVKRG